MLAYRLEMDGVGPYWCSPGADRTHANVKCRLSTSHLTSRLHPSWFEVFNPPPEDYREYLSGCDSLESLKEWFGEFWDELLRVGFDAVTYETNEYILAWRGETDCRHAQLMFKP